MSHHRPTMRPVKFRCTQKKRKPNISRVYDVVPYAHLRLNDCVSDARIRNKFYCGFATAKIDSSNSFSIKKSNIYKKKSRTHFEYENRSRLHRYTIEIRYYNIWKGKWHEKTNLYLNETKKKKWINRWNIWRKHLTIIEMLAANE